MTRLQLNLLGWPAAKVTLETGDVVPQFTSNKVQAILFYLAVTGQPCARDTLIGLLWPETSQKKARVSLRSALYNLQRQLPGVLDVTRKSVTVASECQVELDTAVFSQGVTSDDAERVRQALTLYQGDFLEGFHIDDAPAFDYWRVVERERLRHLALTGLERLADYDESRGKTAVALKSLRRILALEPWRETIHCRIMLLLARDGDYNGAIRQYQQCRAMLDQELGVPPMPETEALYRRIFTLRQRPPKLKLPAPPPTLIGREPELAALTGMLADPACRLIAITGMGGIGKTSLALALAGRQARHFLDGVYFVSLAELDDEALLDTAVADALDLAFPPGAPPRDFLCEHFQDKELLLILDSAEHLQTAVETFIQTLLAAAPELKIIVTSRQKPRLRAASVLALTGLALPDTAVTAVEETPAITLFAQHAARLRRDFSLAAVWPQVVELCHLLAGSPLGIELAAAQLDVTNCVELAARLRATMGELAVDYQDMPPRHRSLRALFQHSWRLLSADEQEALAKLAVFRGGFTPEAAAAATQVDRGILAALVRKSLLHEQDGRFTIHALIRRFAQEHLPADTTIYAQHARYFSQQLHEADLEALSVEMDNIRAMWQYAVTRPDEAVLGETAHRLARFYAVTNQFATGRILFAQAVGHLAETDISRTAPAAWGEILGRYAMFLLNTGRLPEARDAAERSVAVLRGVEDVAALAFSLNLLGVLHIQSGSFATAVTLLAECADNYRRAGETAHLLKPLINLGSVYMRLGQYEPALAYLDKALPLAERLHDRRGMTHILNNRGVIYFIQGDLEAAYEQFAACLPLTEEMDYRPVRMTALENLAEISCKRGDWAQAIRYAEDSLAIAAEIEAGVPAIRAVKVYALALHALGERERAWAELRRAVQTGYAAETLPALLDVLLGVGTLLLAEGDTPAAVALLQFIGGHPATEQQHVIEARELLAKAGAAADEGAGERPLAEVVTAVLRQMP
ncbi:MAG: tetratricopeptide repeat protein [Chloroflexi bacterium]|nr:tetratricopeptide repeat protein [Chloroflexota bacterium]